MTFEPVSIIILNYNGRDFVCQCIESVLKQTYTEKFEVIVVDNCSTDDSTELISSQFADKIKLYQTDSNLGYAGGNFIGYQNAQFDLVVFLNNDTIVLENWLIELVRPLIGNPNIGICSSKVFTPSEGDSELEPNPTLNIIGHNIQIGHIGKNHETFSPHGGSMILRKSVLGFPFDVDYFLYSEDIYAGYLCHYKGYIVVWNPLSKVFHHGSVTAKKTEPIYLSFLKERNRLLNFFIFWPKDDLIKWIPYFIFNFLLKVSVSLFGVKYHWLGILKAYYWLGCNIRQINEKRRNLQLDFSRFRRIPISGKLFASNHFMVRLCNEISILYCQAVDLKVIETKKID